MSPHAAFLSQFQFLALVVHLKCGRKPKGVIWETAFANYAASQILALISFRVVFFPQAYYKLFLRHTENKTSHVNMYMAKLP